MEDIRITPKQLKNIRHALGGKIEKDTYRNYYCTSEECESWNELVEIGFATRRDRETEDGFFYYHATEKAIEALSE